ncbi:MAG TPA: hypothetical protein VK212_11265 [Lentimicrobium sp.]|nr:hypothetical protein [Lentimicrobium sp.]
MKKAYTNPRFLKIPRILELLLHLIAFLLILAIVHYLRIDDYVFDTNFGLDTFFLLFMSSAFIIHRILTTHTIVEELIIDFEQKEIQFNYVLYFLFKRKLIIPFNEFSFYSRLETIIRGGGLSLRIFRANKFKIKISHRYGWTRKHIYCINNEFLKITDGHLRKEPKWQEFYTLVKEKDKDCEKISSLG